MVDHIGTECVRAATAADSSRIAEILVFGKRTAYRRIFLNDVGSFNDLQVAPLLRAYESDPALLHNILVYDDGIVKGMLTRQYETGGPAADEAQLCELYVEPFFTGMGIGHALMSYFLLEATKLGKTRAGLWVLRDNPSAQKFYASFGFAPTGASQEVYDTGVMEVRYVKTL